MRFVCQTILLFSFLAEYGRAGDVSPTPEQVRFFETSIRPLLADHCYKCHGPAKQKANLRLDSRQAILKGGESGSVIVAGQPEKSLLIKRSKKREVISSYWRCVGAWSGWLPYFCFSMSAPKSVWASGALAFSFKRGMGNS